MVLLLAGVIFVARALDRARRSPSIVLLVAVIAVAIWQPAEGMLFNGGFIADGFARYMKFLVLGGSAFALVLSTSTAKPYGLDKFEYSILVLLATLGMMVMVSANDLMSLYVGLELQSLALYVVAALQAATTPRRPKPASSTSSSARSARACCSTARRWSTASPA